ncbi:MAG: hypothetical protein HDR88_12295 [Bacteroides sp.]|nr:hypothetical protein [Bacteroides sp.]
MSFLPVIANPRWKMHTTFDGTIDHVFETPEYVYFTSRAMADMNGQRRMSLFRYDKEGDEIQALSPDNVLSSTTVSALQYCPQKGYVVVVNTNYDITFLYDDGKVVTIPDYRLASIEGEKLINSVTIDPWHDRLYLATKFGYVAINDEKYEIAESRVYNEDIQSVARIGNYFMLLKDADIMYAPASSPRLSLNDYESVNYPTPYAAAPLTENQCLVFTRGGDSPKMMMAEDDGTNLTWSVLNNVDYTTIVNNKKGVLAINRTLIRQVEPDGIISSLAIPEEDYNLKLGSFDLSEVWFAKDRKGIKSAVPGSSATDWVISRDFMIYDAPSPFVTSNLVLHPSRGGFVACYPREFTFTNYPKDDPLLISGYKDGWWTNYAPIYTNEDRKSIMLQCNGIAIDPDNTDYIYVTSLMNGILRLNLSDSEDIIHLSRPADKDKGKPGFIEFVPNQTGKNNWCCNFSAPRLDSDGNLWMVYADMDNQTPPRIHFYCWEAGDRKATTSSENIRLPKKVEVPYDYTEEDQSTVLPLVHSRNKNLLLFSSRLYAGDIAIINTNGTPTDSSDDKLVALKSFIDQDGNDIAPHRLRSFWEDPSTGYVWVCHSEGVFYIDPLDFFKDGSVVCYRPKVSRNDGTNLADRLLEGVMVIGVTTDGKGRKWFSTLGGGLVCTSSDGRTIEEEINTSNSPIPSDNVYGALYLPSSNSLLISTSEGIAEYLLTAEASGSTESDLKIYPNPVRPDYFGYVTIEGLPDRSLVKIVDASGNIVKEFGPVSGDVQWNVTNHQHKRVSSGVYFVLASSGENESAFSSVGKILVVN